MAGGLLNIISNGNNNGILTGNPTKTFFKVTYAKYTNFGLQKFRLDFDGSRDLRLTEPSTYTFKIKRYAELLMDTYVVVTLPDIWSPIYHPSIETANEWAAYDFRWIREIGAQIIREIVITCGGLTLQRYSGAYIAAAVDRDFTAEKKDLFARMTGNVPSVYDPGNAFNRRNAYPSAYFTENAAGPEPSIRGRELYIPINAWFTLDSRCAFPLISLQYNELEITVTLRPIQELFQVRDVFDQGNHMPYVQPDFTLSQFQMYRFLQPPPAIKIPLTAYQNTVQTWNADVHLIATYCFLDDEEAKWFAATDQIYLVKDVFQYDFLNVTGTQKLRVQTSGMVSSWMFYLQRNDVNMRNEWSNRSNWPYHGLPTDVQSPPQTSPFIEFDNKGPLIHPGGGNTGFFISGQFATENRKEILETLAIVFNGEYRENTLTRGIYDYIEKYTRTSGAAGDGLYCYNFGLTTSPFEYQPSGAINMSKFKTIELEISTYVPPFDPANANFQVLCDSAGNIVGINKQNWRLFEYNFNLTLFEERYNILSFFGGNCGMMYAR